jgi:hypothetical protein
MMSIARLGSLGNLIETWDATIKRDRLLAKLANLGIARGAARGQALNRWTREWPLIAAPWPITSGPMGSILRDHPIWSEPNELMGASVAQICECESLDRVPSQPVFGPSSKGLGAQVCGSR